MLPARFASRASARRSSPPSARRLAPLYGAVSRLSARVLIGAPLICALALFSSCSRKIGDDCRTSLDCSQESDRLCDISQPGGYCTVEGCDDGTCPSEAVCIRFFPTLFLTKTCSPTMMSCSADEICLDEGHCASRISERRYCALGCTSNGDCRGGYECRLAGSPGSRSMALLANPAAKVRFCAPVAQ